MKHLYLLCLSISITGGIFPLFADKEDAKVNYIDGYYIFSYSQPVTDGLLLGTVKAKGVTMSNEADELLKLLIRQADKQYKEGNALVITADFQRAKVYTIE